MTHRGSEHQVEDGNLVLPVSLPVALVLIGEVADGLEDKLAHFALELLTEGCHKPDHSPFDRVLVCLFQVLQNVGIWIVLVLILVELSDAQVWQDDLLEHQHQILLEKGSPVRARQGLLNVADNLGSQFEPSLVGRDLGANEPPNEFKSSVLVLGEVLAKFEAVVVQQTSHVGFGFEDFSRQLLHVWVLLGDHELADFHDSGQLVLVELGQFLLT